LREEGSESGAEPGFSAEPACDDSFAGSECGEALDEALRKLPAAQRVPLVLFHFESLSYEEIAANLGVSLGTVKTDIFRAREALRKRLQPAFRGHGMT
jgi:RNA polymerase sigma-70 factor (ECF subfamily)